MELHIFDFDGVVFHSPAPSLRVRAEHGDRTFSMLTAPLTDRGLGWFQSLATLCPPAVPEFPPVDEWYVEPIVNRMRELAQRPEPVVVTVLTGRDEKFRPRIEDLLHNAALRDMIHAVLLKPHETYGTVRHKLECFHSLIAEHRPARVFYYEDRADQGAHLLSGARRLATAVSPRARVETVFLDADGKSRPGEMDCHFNGRAAERWWEVTEPGLREGAARLSPFDFTLVMVDPALALRREGAIGEKAEDDLIAHLWREKEAYDAKLPPTTTTLCSAPCQHWIVLATNTSESYKSFLCARESPGWDGAQRFRLDHLLPTDWTALLRECRAHTGPRGSFNFSSPGDVSTATDPSALLPAPHDGVLNIAFLHIVERCAGDFVPNNILYHRLQQQYILRANDDFSTWLREAQSALPLPITESPAAAEGCGNVRLSADANDPLALDAAALEKTAQNEWAVSGVPRYGEPPRVFVFFPNIVSLADCVPYHTRHFAVLVNLRPAVPGHLMLVPVRCVATIHALRDDELEDFGRVMCLAVRVIARHVGAAASSGGFSIAVQQGVLAGQTVPHLHVHVLPFDPLGKLAGEPELEDNEKSRPPPRTAAEMREETEALRPLFEEFAQCCKKEDVGA